MALVISCHASVLHGHGVYPVEILLLVKTGQVFDYLNSPLEVLSEDYDLATVHAV